MNRNLSKVMSKANTNVMNNASGIANRAMINSKSGSAKRKIKNNYDENGNEIFIVGRSEIGDGSVIGLGVEV